MHHKLTTQHRCLNGTQKDSTGVCTVYHRECKIKTEHVSVMEYKWHHKDLDYIIQ